MNVPSLTLLLALTIWAAAAADTPEWACSSVWSPAGPPTKVCADQSCNAKQANYRGQILMLSAGSMSYTHGGFNPIGSNPAECCKLCQQTDLCTAWVFCNRKEGCGWNGSCPNYIKSLGNSTAPMSSNRAAALPVLGFGPFGPGCTQDGLFPYQMCSLKSPSNLVAYSNGDEPRGFVSGFMPRKTPAAPGCPAVLTAATCTACSSTAAPSKCYQCTRQAQLWGSGSASCVACASLPTEKQRNSCMSCLKDFPGSSSSCSGCIQWLANNTVNIAATAACFDCVATAGPAKRNVSGCVQCYKTYPQPTNMTACLSCSSDNSLSAAASYGCASCYKEPSVQYLDGCKTCLKQFNTATITTAATNCAGCAKPTMQAVPDIAQMCYACVAKSTLTAGYYCSNMEDPALLSGIMPDYYKCLALPDALTGSGSSCGSCLYPPVYPKNSGSCLACVGSLSSNPAGATWCSSCWNGQTKRSISECEACLLKAGDAGYTCTK